MSKTIRVFVDSDVVISVIISQTGAAGLLINDDRVDKRISDYSLEELDSVVKRLKLNQALLERILTKTIAVDLDMSKLKIQRRFTSFVNDKNDAHVIAGAIVAKAKFLLTYNQKHYNTDQIKNELGITVLTPALFLQYLRSLER
ncbi:MAG: putative toxin-antitoxin system toxin component, PIN family [Candidatus Berkelbacteria bacterium]|nr:putative toxin-antitoxin system toxin component, PIN family [Candidatus Berkelbacteria bacterium]MCR4307860.1 putative toxin-antitoxin system toxin component, PIN family [Candidatus Berkelbacteria bacterium]